MDNNRFSQEQIGKTLKIIRKNAARPLSQLDFALEIGVSDSVIGKIERGLRYPTVEILVDYMNTFHVDANTVFGFKQYQEVPRYESVDERLNVLDDETREYLLGVFNQMLDYHMKKRP